eukprot:9500505-Pyramimonas_sp.AAC.1
MTFQAPPAGRGPAMLWERPSIPRQGAVTQRSASLDSSRRLVPHGSLRQGAAVPLVCTCNSAGRRRNASPRRSGRGCQCRFDEGIPQFQARACGFLRGSLLETASEKRRESR